MGVSEVNQPQAGTCFSTEGHYGSTLFDLEGEGLSLELNLCDPCLRELAEQELVLLVKRTQARPAFTYTRFQPPPEP